MATSPNYNWPEPDNTDLVKNGALAMRTLGDAIDTTMATMVPKSIVDAKGDLIAGTAADTAARLAVGNNGETLVADSSTSTGLRYQSGYNGNAIINGGMDIWQRGTSIAYGINTGVYTADRWTTLRTASPSGATVSRQASSLTGIQYCARVQRDSGNTTTAPMYFGTNLESADSYRFAGQTVTLSYYARKGANYSPTSSELIGYIYTGTGTDQSFVTGFTGGAQSAGNVTLTTSWQRFTITATIPSNVTQIAIYYAMTPTGTAGAADYYEVTGVQLELGSVATQFKRSNGSGGTIQGELAACQRYYIRLNTANITGAQIGVGFAGTTSIGTFSVPLPVTLRSRSSNTLDYANLRLMDYNNGYTGISTVGVYQGATDNLIWINVNMSSAVLTQYRPLFIDTQANGYLGIGAEL